MNNDSPLAVILRRKWVVIGTFLVVVLTAAVLSQTLEKVYSTESTLLVALPSNNQTFDTVQAGQAIARSYADIIESPNIAERVGDRLGGLDAASVLAGMSFEPIPETQLIKITAEDPNPARAKEIADTYADVFTDYARLSLSDTDARVSIADPAPLPASPARPKPTLYVLIAAVLGLALGLALAVVTHRLDHRLRTADDVEAQFDLPLLARIPRRRRSEQGLSAFQEAYRVLRTNLRFSRDAGPLRSIAVTSGNAGEGKTTTVANLALAFAEAGRRVIVVEGDFRRPALHAELLEEGTESLRPGLSNYLVENAELEDIIHATGRPFVSFVPAGPLPPGPSALLDSKRGRSVVEALARRADVILVDSPPLSIGADASVISQWVDGVMVVLDLNTSTDRSVRGALRQLEAVQAPVIGLLVNRDRTLETESYDYRRAPAGEPKRGQPPADAVSADNGAGAGAAPTAPRAARKPRIRERR